MEPSKVRLILTTTALFITGVGTLDKTLYSRPQKYPDLKMELHDAGVKVSLKNKTAIIPFSQIQVIELA